MSFKKQFRASIRNTTWAKRWARICCSTAEERSRNTSSRSSLSSCSICTPIGTRQRTLSLPSARSKLRRWSQPRSCNTWALTTNSSSVKSQEGASLSCLAPKVTTLTTQTRLPKVCRIQHDQVVAMRGQKCPTLRPSERLKESRPLKTLERWSDA